MTIRSRILAAAVLLLACSSAIPAQEESSRLSIDRIYASGEFNEKSFSAEWLPSIREDASAEYVRYTAPDDGEGGKQFLAYDAITGERRPLVSDSDLVVSESSSPLSVDGHQWSRDLGRLLIYTNSKRVWRRNTRGDYWVLDRGAKQLQRIGGDVPPSSTMFAKFSPDGQAVAYVHDGNLYVHDLLDGSINKLTSKSHDRIINGTSDWVYEEEFGLRDAFHWSPDGQKIAYWKFNTTGVRDFTLINNLDSIYPTIQQFAYPKVGTRNSDVRIGVVDRSGGDTYWLPIPGDPRDNYVPRVQWIETGMHAGDLFVRRMNRLQNQERILRLDSQTGKLFVEHTENDACWIDLQDELNLAADGAAFYYVSDRDGWRHLYRIPFDDEPQRLLTPGEFDIESLEKVNPISEDDDEIYFIASPENATERYLYRVVAGEGVVRRVTPDGLVGVHTYDISPDGKHAIHRFSNANTPTKVELVSLPDHETVRTLESNEELVEKVAKLEREPVEFFKIDLGEVSLDAWCMKPPNMRAGKKYPLIVYVYGEPAGSTVVNRWGNRNAMWHTLLTQMGYVVVSIDNRGTAAPRGRSFRKSVYGKIGILGPDDQALAVKKLLADRDYLDPERVGVWGWSGGGSSSLHAIFRYPELYKTAVSIAPVANQRYYDTIYQERYMGLPSTNVEGFREGSPINHADRLQGNLLLIHGTADDNVHYQATELLINELIALDKQFDMFIYPSRTHSISERKNTRRHLMSTVTRYFERTLPPGPR